jgi:hypothetical protein
MSPVLGIIASSTRQGQTTAVGSYDSLATVTVPSGGLTQITFAGIPAGYRDLQVRILQMTSGTTNPKFRVNGDATTSNYYMHSMYNSIPTISVYNEANLSALSYLYNEGTFPAVAIIDVLDYANTSKNKTFKTLGGYDANGSGYIFFRSQGWFQTTAINSLTFITDTSNFLQHSQFALYGVK